MERTVVYFILAVIIFSSLMAGSVMSANTAAIDEEMSNMKNKTATFAMG